ncbi:conserved oligomeric Golgi complex subunit 7 [Trichonephila inaurata madagascariensis]|uniref:Conserved oligomeric Golgi complex subunit 7 n=1 Tax=Trichonephila inaurata madagascariensis TaxID=2747483 RepID=A0A8X6Y7H4_9ARAC|nr:conserved oligomeric Golgi complex subunit 7 [Trichonephila inaurata madagascariensis]
MDLSAFSKDDFDPKEWINKTFQCAEAKENKEEFATTIVAKLQSFIQEVNISLEKTAEQVNQNIPRIAREIEVMQNEAKLLQQQMSSVKGDVMKVEYDSSQSMQALLQIDHVKSCMQEASKALREADNWTTLSADVEEVFESGDINTIATKLVGMQSSLEILADVPDYHQRCMRLESLKDRLEVMISPRLIAAFNTQSIVSDVGLMYMKIFKDIKRLNTLQKHYHTFQKVKTWLDNDECVSIPNFDCCVQFKRPGHRAAGVAIYHKQNNSLVVTPHLDIIYHQTSGLDSTSNVADYLLECLARRITDCYCENILKISHLKNNASNQLVTDISYFCDVLDDLGLTPSPDLQNLLALLKVKPDKFDSEARNKPPLIVRKVSAMRKVRVQ